MKELELAAQAPEYWADNRRAKQEQEKMHAAQSDLALARELLDLRQDLATSHELLGAEDDQELLGDFERKLAGAVHKLDGLDFRRMLSGPFDRNNAILNIHPGAGGTESQDWAQMLLRMYTRWAEAQGFQVGLLDLQAGEEAGIKNATLKIDGEWAYGFLRSEKGIHRLVRISPFDSNARRHTSFASVEPFPEIDDTIEVEIAEKDLKIEVFRASGAGGQHVNRTESAVRMTHLPTGIVVSCQNERSQIKNRALAMQVLKARLFARAQEEQKEKMASIAGEKKDINFGSQIRSYVLHPYRQIKDHRTNQEYHKVEDVLDGDLDPLIRDYLRHHSLSVEASHAG